MAIRSADAELVERRSILPGRWLQTYAAPWLASGAVRAGQYVCIRADEDVDPPTLVPLPMTTADRVTGQVSVHLQVTGPETARLARTRPGERVAMSGPWGRPFEVAPRARHLLLLASDWGIAGLRALIDQALAADRLVTLLLAAPSAAEVYPSSLLPPEVEYVVATRDGSLGQTGDLTDLLPAYERWADQAFASGPRHVLETLAALAAGRAARLGVARLGRKGGRSAGAARGTLAGRRRAWLQVLPQQTVACATGTCLRCVVDGVDGPLRVCRDGPVFAADEIAWDEPST